MNDIVDVGKIGDYVLALIPYIPVTLAISVIASGLGVALGLLIAVIKIRRIPVLHQITVIIVSYLRGTPILVQLLLNINAVPILVLLAGGGTGGTASAIAVPSFAVATATFALHEAAYSSETIRAALLSVDKGQVEAAQSLGMTGWQVLRRVTVPNASVVALPTLANQFIGMLKQSSLAFTVSVIEITAYAKILGGRDYRYFEAYLATAIVYWAMTVVVEQLVGWGERHLAIASTGGAGRRGRRARSIAPASSLGSELSAS